jgi:hypothetical protein
LPGPKIRPTPKRPMLLLVALATQLVAVQRQETHRQKGERQLLPGPKIRPTQLWPEAPLLPEAPNRPLLLLVALATPL